MTGARADAPLIEFRDVTVLRGEKKALDRFSLSIGSGEHVAVLGPNGCGKSTFIRTVTREFYPAPVDGESFCRILGEERWNVFDLRAHLGIVSDSLQKTCDRPLTGRETVLSGFFSSIGLFLNHRVTPEMERKTDEAMAFMEVSHLAGRDMDTMSSGEARRMLIARALVHEPRALILDEPTNSLDLHAAHTFRDAVRRIAASGRGVIMVTHHLHDIIPEITRVVLVRDGRVVDDGPKERVLTAPALSSLFSVSVEIREKDGYYYAW